MDTSYTTFCLACESTKGIRHLAKEKMFGLGGAFLYLECAKCGSLRLLDPPQVLKHYYPPGYYSHAQTCDITARIPDFLAGMDLSVTAPAWTAFARATTTEHRRAIIEDCIRRAIQFYFCEALSHDARILDVGAGTGAFVYWLRRIGFSRAIGIDPYIPEDLRLGCETLVEKGELKDVDGGWDIVIFNHSLEHVSDAVSTLHQVVKRLVHGGRCLIRIPMASSWAWKHYGIDWVQLDAPRHVFIPSEKAMLSILKRVGLATEQMVYDSGIFQLIGSEAYVRGESLVSANGEPNDWATKVSGEDMVMFTQHAAFLNLARCGDQAAFCTKRVPCEATTKRK